MLSAADRRTSVRAAAPRGVPGPHRRGLATERGRALRDAAETGARRSRGARWERRSLGWPYSRTSAGGVCLTHRPSRRPGRRSSGQPTAGPRTAPSPAGRSISVSCARQRPHSAHCSFCTCGSPSTPTSAWSSSGWWSCTWPSAARPSLAWPSQIVRVRTFAARRIRLTVSDLLLLFITLNVLVSGVLDWGRGEPIQLPLPRPFDRWHLDSGLVLVVYLTVHVWRRRKRLRRSTIR